MAVLEQRAKRTEVGSRVLLCVGLELYHLQREGSADGTEFANRWSEMGDAGD